MPILIPAVGLLGLAIGSFLNVVIYRVPRQLSLLSPPSACPSCEHPIRVRHNVPVLGWLVLTGHCADCRSRISVRYPLVEFGTGALFVLVSLQLAHLKLLPALPAFLYFAAIGVALSLIDLDSHRLPNPIVLPSYPVLALMLTAAALVQGSPSSLMRAAIGGAALFGAYFLLMFAYPAGMGFGDVKLAGIIGGMLGYLSYHALLIGAFAAFFLGSLISVFVLLSRRGSRKTQIPFGPFMILGAILALFLSRPLADLYSHLVFKT
jgi:leader peptidase (prepilin peptidase)/N-methyltransferase